MLHSQGANSVWLGLEGHPGAGEAGAGEVLSQGGQLWGVAYRDRR